MGSSAQPRNGSRTGTSSNSQIGAGRGRFGKTWAGVARLGHFYFFLRDFIRIFGSIGEGVAISTLLGA